MKWSTLVLAGLLPVLAAASPTPLAIDPSQSRIEILVKTTVDSFTGTLGAYEADMLVDDEQVTAANVKFRVADVHTGKEKRDDAMHAWQDTPRYPGGVFTLKSLTKTGGDGRMDARGLLTFHGVAREITFPVVIAISPKRSVIDGEASVDTRDFGLPIIRKLGLLKVDPIVRVRFHLEGAVGGNPTKPL
jgi:polyisoprenoid-binding protein YceI